MNSQSDHLQNEVFLLLGSNLGDPLENIEKAHRRLAEIDIAIQQTSSYYRTAPWGNPDQPWFINQGVVVSTRYPATDLLARLKVLESGLGRKSTGKWQPRIIDIDILFYGNQVITETGLTIPHPQVPYRRFALVCLNEIASHFVHPVLRKSVSELLALCKDPLVAERVTPDS